MLGATTGSYDRTDLRAGFNLPIGDNAALFVSGIVEAARGLSEAARLHLRDEPTRHAGARRARFRCTTPLQNTTRLDNVDDCTIGHYGGEDVRARRASLDVVHAPSAEAHAHAATICGDLSQNPAGLHRRHRRHARASANVCSQASYFGVTVDNRFSHRRSVLHLRERTPIAYRPAR